MKCDECGNPKVYRDLLCKKCYQKFYGNYTAPKYVHEDTKYNTCVTCGKEFEYIFLGNIHDKCYSCFCEEYNISGDSITKKRRCPNSFRRKKRRHN